MAATIVPHKGTTPKRTGPSVFGMLFAICQLFCAAPVIGPSKFRKVLHYAWCFIIIISLLIAIYYAEVYILNFPSPTIRTMLSISRFIGNILLILISIFTSYRHSDCYSIFPERLQEIERRTLLYQRKLSHHQTRHNIDRKAAAYLAIAAAFYASFLVSIAYNVYNGTDALKFAVAYALPSANIDLFLGQYWVLIKFATLRYKGINAVLEETRRPDQRRFCSMVHSKSRWDAAAVIDDLRTAYAQLDNLVGDIHDVFGLAITVNFLTSFLSLNIQIFMLYLLFDMGDKWNWSLIAYATILMVMNFGKILFILNVNRSLLTEKATTGSILNDIDTDDIEIDDAISRFLLQLVVNKSIHVVCGMIDLDMSFLGGILSALSIYVIFLIQVDLSESP